MHQTMHDRAQQCTTTRSSAEQCTQPCTQQCSQPLPAVHSPTPRCTGALPWQSRLLSAPSTRPVSPHPPHATGCSDHPQGSLHLPCKPPGLMFPPAAEPSPFLRAVWTPPALPRCAEALHIIYPRVYAVPRTRVFFCLSRPGSALCSAAPPSSLPCWGGTGNSPPPREQGHGGKPGHGGFPHAAYRGCANILPLEIKGSSKIAFFFFPYFAGVVSSYNIFFASIRTFAMPRHLLGAAKPSAASPK